MAVFIHEPMMNGNSGPRCFQNREFSHLMADTEEELRAYAASVGLPSGWIQKSGTNRVHFDLTGKWLKFTEADVRVLKLSFGQWRDRMRAGG